MFMVGIYSGQLECLWHLVSAFRIFIVQYVCATCPCKFHTTQFNLSEEHDFTGSVSSNSLNLCPHGQISFSLSARFCVSFLCLCRGLDWNQCIGSFLKLMDRIVDEADWFTVTSHWNFLNMLQSRRYQLSKPGEWRLPSASGRRKPLGSALRVLKMKAWTVDYPKGTWDISTHLTQRQRKLCQ